MNSVEIWPSILGGISFVSLLILLAIRGLQKSVKDSDEIYKGLDQIEEKAKAATSCHRLQEIYEELKSFSKQRCWHRHHGSRVREVAAYIQGKFKAYADMKVYFNPEKKEENNAD